MKSLKQKINANEKIYIVQKIMHQHDLTLKWNCFFYATRKKSPQKIVFYKNKWANLFRFFKVFKKKIVHELKEKLWLNGHDIIWEIVK